MSGRLLAIGDVHGCYEPLRELVEERIRLDTSDRLVMLGDYLDRGPRIREVVEYIMNLKVKGFDIIPLIGNHEAMLLESDIDTGHLSNWILNGGDSTLYSFGIDSVKQMGEKYLQFFRSLVYYYCEGRYIFVHAGFNDELKDPFQDRFQMIWSRREHYSNPVFSDSIIIHGHTPVTLSECSKLVSSGSAVLNLDTGCVYGEWEGYGYLTALEIKTGELFSVKSF
jgi:serine/threonine protein phosphatase 1